eukprot:1085825-Pleurochrysis_carterae.AAC.1
MESHEEKLANMIRQSKEREAVEEMKRKARTIARENRVRRARERACVLGFTRACGAYIARAGTSAGEPRFGTGIFSETALLNCFPHAFTPTKIASKVPRAHVSCHAQAVRHARALSLARWHATCLPTRAEARARPHETNTHAATCLPTSQMDYKLTLIHFLLKRIGLIGFGSTALFRLEIVGLGLGVVFQSSNRYAVGYAVRVSYLPLGRTLPTRLRAA